MMGWQVDSVSREQQSLAKSGHEMPKVSLSLAVTGDFAGSQSTLPKKGENRPLVSTWKAVGLLLRNIQKRGGGEGLGSVWSWR